MVSTLATYGKLRETDGDTHSADPLHRGHAQPHEPVGDTIQGCERHRDRGDGATEERSQSCQGCRA